jgi:hypothetical protein
MRQRRRGTHRMHSRVTRAFDPAASGYPPQTTCFEGLACAGGIEECIPGGEFARRRQGFSNLSAYHSRKASWVYLGSGGAASAAWRLRRSGILCPEYSVGSPHGSISNDLFSARANAELIEPHYPKACNGTQPMPQERMLRIYFMQQWFKLSDRSGEPVPAQATIDHCTGDVSVVSGKATETTANPQRNRLQVCALFRFR